MIYRQSKLSIVSTLWKGLIRHIRSTASLCTTMCLDPIALNQSTTTSTIRLITVLDTLPLWPVHIPVARSCRCYSHAVVVVPAKVARAAGALVWVLVALPGRRLAIVFTGCCGRIPVKRLFGRGIKVRHGQKTMFYYLYLKVQVSKNQKKLAHHLVSALFPDLSWIDSGAYEQSSNVI